MLTATLLCLAGHLPLALPAAPPTVKDRYAVRADKVHVGGGTVHENGTILVEAGRILAVGGADLALPEGTMLHVLEGELSAGMIALQDASGADGGLHDSTRSVIAEAKVAHGLRPESKDLERALAAGITTIVVSPSPENLVGGRTAVLKTSGGTLLHDAAHLSVTFSNKALANDRYPTSYASAIDELRTHFTDPVGPFAEATSGKLPVLFHVSRRQDAANAMAFAKEFGLKGALHGAALIGELSEEVKASGLAVVHAPLDWNTSGRALEAVKDLAKAGVPFGFGLDSPERSPEGLRISAAMAVRAGVDANQAWSSLTSDAARIAGVDQRVGTLAEGRDADFVLWSGSPLDLGSRPKAVYVNGKQAWEADAR